MVHAGRPVFIVERPFREFFFNYFKPYEHYMPVKADLSDLVEKVAEIKSDKVLAKRLGENASAFAEKYLTYDFATAHFCKVMLSIGKANY